MRSIGLIHRCTRLAALTLSLGVLSLPASAGPEHTCKAPHELVHFKAPLPGLARVLVGTGSIRIAALGSSSTAGTGASGPKSCYPARLQAELVERFPGRAVEVRNLGVGGQMAGDMLSRIEREVIPAAPTLVVWQTGVNDAVQHADLANFRAVLVKGIDRMRAAGIDVVLLDSQYFPKAEVTSGFSGYLDTMRQVAQEKGVPILHRFAIMKHLIATAQYTAEQMLAPDRFHQNDLSYGCLGHLLADAIVDDVSETMKARAVQSAGAASGLVPGAAATSMH
jgi:acyl-CoA thioesterase I